MLTQDDFYDKAKNFALFKDCDGKYFTFDEYQTLIKDNQTDKEGNLIYLYAQDKEAQYVHIEAAKNKGYNVLLLDGQLDTPVISMLERKFEKSRFTRVDADIIDRLIVKEDANKSELEAERSANLSAIFEHQMPKLDKTEFHVEAQSMGESGMPVTITQSEYMRRMKDMAHIQPGMSFYGEMPDMYTLVLNTDHKLIREVLEDSEKSTAEALKPVEAEIKGLHAREAVLRQQQEGKKTEEIDQTQKDELEKCNADIKAEEDKKSGILNEYGKENRKIHQLIDLALLQNGMLKGESLNNFIKRSIDLID